jgi:hypothetical protein
MLSSLLPYGNAPLLALYMRRYLPVQGPRRPPQAVVRRVLRWGGVGGGGVNITLR